MSACALRVSGLGKAFRKYRSEWQRVASWCGASVRPSSEHWVLRNVSFSVAPGEAVGIIGQNGAGKSTLLKLITGTQRATEGGIEINGRIAAILELGMGFNSEFTGRQNVYHAVGLMGFSREAIEQAMPEIEAFAEIGEYFNEPLRTYSSGMQMRVAFSVATAFRPEILIVDEALAVGDVYFQQKCFERIRDYSASGTTLLFVSHSAGAILDLCSRAILLREGKLIHDGNPKEIIDLYQADLLVQLDKAPNKLVVSRTIIERSSDIIGAESDVHSLDVNRETPSLGSIRTVDVECLSVNLLDCRGVDTQAVMSDSEVSIQISYQCNSFLEDPHVGFKIRNRFGVVLFETNTYCMNKQIGSINANEVLTVTFSFLISLMPDEYTITVGFANKGVGDASFEEVLSYLHNTFAFSVIRNMDSIKWAGLINLNPEVSWKTNRVVGF